MISKHPAVEHCTRKRRRACHVRFCELRQEVECCPTGAPTTEPVADRDTRSSDPASPPADLMNLRNNRLTAPVSSVSMVGESAGDQRLPLVMSCLQSAFTQPPWPGA